MISVIIPAYNEEGFIGETLQLMLQSDVPAPKVAGAQPDIPSGAPPVEVIVVANGCRDATVAEAQELTGAFLERGWALKVLALPTGSKTLALNAGSAAARYPKQIFVDADIHVSPGLFAALDRALDRPEPCYASGRPRIRRAQSWLSHRYAQFWQRLPFMATGVPGCGLYAVNAAGRARWTQIPEVTADDIFVRSHFSPEERTAVPDTYSWPIAEGLVRLVRVRRRQNQGLSELSIACPGLHVAGERTAPDGLRKLELLVSDPVGFAVYAGVALLVRTPVFANRRRWERGRGDD